MNNNSTESALIFFDKEGYPYNFQYDPVGKLWEGKIFFDENSSDTFRTICLYIFENVPAFNFSSEFEFKKSELFNWSGMTFAASIYEDEIITNIKKVNSNVNFYSKWIIGNDFDKKFPIGTLITFSGVTGTGNNDFSNGTTYNVVGSQKNSFLICTQTNNSVFTFDFSGGTVSSVNAIKVSDCGQDLVNISDLNYYNGKKLSVVGSSKNDGIYTYNDYEILKTSIYDFLLLPEDTNTQLNLEFYLMTQRPELYEGIVNITYNSTNSNNLTGTTIEFVNGINTNIDFVGTGQTIVFEKPDGSYIMDENLDFTITGYIDKEFIITDYLKFYTIDGINTIESLSGITGLSYNDIIELTAFQFVSGQTFHDKRRFQVTNIENNKIQVREYIITEDGHRSVALKTTTNSNIVEINEPMNLSYFHVGDIISGNSNIIDGSTILSISGETWKFIISTNALNTGMYKTSIIKNIGSVYTINKIINKKKIKKVYCKGLPTLSPLPFFSGYTICYSTTNKIKLIQDFVASGTTSEYFYENTISAMRNKYRTLLNRYGIDLYHYNISGNNYLISDGVDYNFNPFYSGVTATLISGSTTNILTIGNNFAYTGSTDSNIYYFKIYEQLSKEKIYLYELSKLSKNFRTEIYFDIEKDPASYGFRLKLNGTEYYIPLSGISSTYTQDTINDFITKYYQTFNANGFNVYSGYTDDVYSGYTLIVEGQEPNIILYELEVKVNSYSSYDIIDNILNDSIVISSNELKSSSILNYFELSTGMIINVSGATNYFNNKQYNIIKLTGDTSETLDTIQLSYQGPFIEEDNKILNISVNSFLRKPRGTYAKEKMNDDGISVIDDGRYIQYKVSWSPIDTNVPKITTDIFYYDYSGEQLLANGELTYIGEKPLWSDSNNLIFLNTEPNKNIQNISIPNYQQTVFDSLTFNLERLNSSTNYNYIPEPFQVFIGFNSKTEGVSTNNMIIERIDNVILSGRTTPTNNFVISGDTITCITIDKFFDFSSFGFNAKQLISIDFKEITLTGHTLFDNYYIYEITSVSPNKIKVDSILNYFESSGKTYSFIIKTEPIIISSFYIYGETEVEDERYVQHLKLLGVNLESEVQSIFKESDINDRGIDYTILNRKRKELLSIYPEIYNYIGSYKSLINSINFFGYNDLDLYEYYRNINPKSPLYGKLQKTLIEDIFINTIPGWDEIEMDNSNHLKTNLFNLTYKITDFEGNYLDLYSLDEVQRKLTGLVNWLRKNIIPLSANILDITGLANTRTTIYSNYNAANYVKKITILQENSAINFDYIQTLNIDTNYLFTINFYLTSGSTQPDYFTVKIKTFHLNESTLELEPVQYMNLYKTDMLSYSFNVDKNIDPYMYIETQSYNDYGLGYTNTKLFESNEGRNFVLIDNNFTGINYKYITTDYGYYIITDGRFYIIPY